MAAHDREALARARGELTDHRRVFRALERHALGATDPISVAGRAQVAIDAAVRRHTGLLVSAELEQRLHELGRAHVAPDTPGRPRPGGRRVERVLHVLTQAYDYGGHTRVAERWILADSQRTPTVLLTGQGAVPVPPTLQAAVRANGGGIVALPGGDLLTRAWNLRALAAEHDAVVLHVHMHDVVPALALAEPDGRPPTILFNHASHQMWLGVGIADVIANFSQTDDDHTRARRGAAPESSVILPIPVARRELPTRDQARAALGIEPAAQVILAVGAAYKVSPALEPAFTDLVAEVVRASPDAHCVTVGPLADAAWTALALESGGRARALGPQSIVVVDQLLAAADVLLDTWPVTGGTTLLDAGFASLPVVSLGNWGPELAMIRPPAEMTDVVRAPNPGELAQAVAELLADEPRRRALGERGRASVESEHATGWNARMEAVLERAQERAGEAAPPRVDPSPQATEWECVLQLLHDAAGNALPPEYVMLEHAADLPPEERPADVADAHARVEAIIRASEVISRRAVSAPALEAAAIARLLSEVRALVQAGEIDFCSVAVAGSSMSEAVSLFEAEMIAGDDVDIELVPASDIAEIARPGDRVLQV
jgi:glycosyltransferase involved in cell wall biosynthesis